MRFPPAPAPFTDRITCVGRFSIDDRVTAPLDVLIDVSPSAAHGIRGWILGNSATADDIRRVQGRHDGALHFSASTGAETLSSKSAWIRSTGSFGRNDEDMPHGLHGIACGFQCLDLTRRFERGEESKAPREVRFLLRGPWPAGLAWWSHEYSFTGNNKVKLGGSALALGGGLNFSVFVLPHFLHDGVFDRGDEDEDGARRERAVSETSVHAMACRTWKSDEYGDEAFLDEARRAVEDVCLLLSFLAGGMITWQGYHRSGPGISERFDRSMSGRVDEKRGHEIVDAQDLREFLRLAFRRLRRLRVQGIDLEMPLVSSIVGTQQGVARQRFGEFFLALEALHSLHLESRGKTFMLEKTVFRKVQSTMGEPLRKALLEQGVRSPRIHERMRAKLGELNRPPLWDGVKDLMAGLKVDWEDLYAAPAPDRPPFLRLRNRLFHSHGREDDETIYKESIRVEAVVHRILLRWLGWQDLWNAPPPEVRHFVSARALPDHHPLTGRKRRKRR